MSETNHEATQPPGPRLFTGFFALAIAAACVAALVFLLTPRERAPRTSFIAPTFDDSRAPRAQGA